MPFYPQNGFLPVFLVACAMYPRTTRNVSLQIFCKLLLVVLTARTPASPQNLAHHEHLGPIFLAFRETFQVRTKTN